MSFQYESFCLQPVAMAHIPQYEGRLTKGGMKWSTSSQGYGSNSHVQVAHANNMVLPIVILDTPPIFAILTPQKSSS